MPHLFTAGKWYLSPSGSMVLASGEDGTDRIVCHLSLTRGPLEAIANGSLIESAPVMLCALEAMESLPAHLAECRLCKGGMHKICKVATAAVDACRDALARVREQEVPS